MKKARAQRADVKEVKFTIRIDDNDKNIKVQHIKEFLAEGNVVKVSIVLAKREMARLDYAKTMMKSILNCFDGIARMEGAPSLEGRVMSCTLKKV